MFKCQVYKMEFLVDIWSKNIDGSVTLRRGYQGIYSLILCNLKKKKKTLGAMHPLIKHVISISPGGLLNPFNASALDEMMR